MNHQEIYRKNTAWDRGEGRRAAIGRPVLIWALTAAAVSAVVLVLVGFGLGRRQAAELKTCASASPWLTTITDQQRRGRYDLARANAETAIATPNLCRDDVTALANAIVANGAEAIFSTPFDPRDIGAQQRAVTDMRSLQSTAQRYGVTFPSATQIASRAFGVSLWMLAKEEFDDAWRASEFGPADQTLIQRYVSTTYNLGWWMATATTGDTKRYGIRLLVTAYLVDNAWHVGDGQAFAALNRVAGSDPAGWPPPVPSPLIPADQPATGAPN